MSSPGYSVAAFVDVNIFIDILQRRSGWISSLQVVDRARRGVIRGCVSSLTVAITYFVHKNHKAAKISDARARADIKNLMQGFDILSVDSGHVISSLADERFNDFEDALQFHSAKENAGCHNNQKQRDYSRVAGEIQVLSPEEFLKGRS